MSPHITLSRKQVLGYDRDMPLIFFLLLAWAVGSEPALADDPPQPPAAVARDIEILNRMLQQRKNATSNQTPSPPSQPAPAVQPATQPAAQPATQPAAQPTSQPTVRPANQPANQPAAQPAAQPATVADARIAKLIAGLDDESMPAREKARGELVKIGKPAVPDLLIALEDAETRGRVGAAMALGAIKDPRAAEPLVGLLYASSSDLRGAVYQAIPALGPPAVPALLDALDKPGNTERTVIVRMLAEIGDHGATEALVALLRRDPSTGFRMEVASALGRIKDRTACDALLDALRDC